MLLKWPVRGNKVVWVSVSFWVSSFRWTSKVQPTSETNTDVDFSMTTASGVSGKDLELYLGLYLKVYGLTEDGWWFGVFCYELRGSVVTWYVWSFVSIASHSGRVTCTYRLKRVVKLQVDLFDLIWYYWAVCDKASAVWLYLCRRSFGSFCIKNSVNSLAAHVRVQECEQLKWPPVCRGPALRTTSCVMAQIVPHD